MHAVFTGPIQGEVRLSDGTMVDVTPPVIYVDTEQQAAEVASLIGDRHENEGHPWHDAERPFRHQKES